MKKRLPSLLCILLLVFYATTAYADTPSLPLPWYIDLEDGLVFHYRPNDAHYSPYIFPWGSSTSAEFEARGYLQTGLYRNEELIYTVDVPIREALYFSNDGMSFVEINGFVHTGGRRGIYTQPAVHFFEYGNLIHYYEVPDLVRNLNSIAYTVSHAQWDYQNERHHDRENNLLLVRTRDGRNITFDLSTGLILSGQRSFSNLIFWASVEVVVLAVAMLIGKRLLKSHI